MSWWAAAGSVSAFLSCGSLSQFRTLHFSPVEICLMLSSRLKVLFDSSTPIVILETIEETRAVRLVHAAASALDLAVFRMDDRQRAGSLR